MDLKNTSTFLSIQDTDTNIYIYIHMHIQIYRIQGAEKDVAVLELRSEDAENTR